MFGNKNTTNCLLAFRKIGFNFIKQLGFLSMKSIFHFFCRKLEKGGG